MSARATSIAHPQPVFTRESSVAERLAACKAYLAAESERIHQQHKAGAPGHKIAHALAGRMDRLLQPLFAAALSAWRKDHGEPPTPVCLIALGGYGRGELSPLSDIDVMFLYPANAKGLAKFQEHLTNGVLYPLWDLRLKVGHSSRNLNEVFTEAVRDMEKQLQANEAWANRPKPVVAEKLPETLMTV